MIPRPFIWLSGGAAALLLLLTGCRSTPVPVVRLAMDSRYPLPELPVRLAIALGYFKEEGVTVDVRELNDDAAIGGELAGGRVDVIAGSFDNVLKMAAEGKPARAFTLISRSLMLSVVAPAPAPGKHRRKAVETLDDLAGVTAGVSAMGASDFLYLKYALIETGIEASEVRIAALGSGDAVAEAIGQGKVGAAVVDGVTLRRQAAPEGGFVLLSDTRTIAGVLEVYGVATYPGIVLYARNLPEPVGRRLANAVHRATEWALQHRPDEILAKMPKLCGSGVEPSLCTAAITETQPMLSRDGRISLESVRAARKALTVAMDRVPSIELSSTFTDEFVGTAH